MTTMAKLSTDDLLDAFKEMTLLELSDFVKKFEDAFDVKAAAPAPRPRSRRRTSSTSSSKPRATRRSRSSRKSAP
jgi:large subunit ribosomal protein L7/L12